MNGVRTAILILENCKYKLINLQSAQMHICIYSKPQYRIYLYLNRAWEKDTLCNILMFFLLCMNYDSSLITSLVRWDLSCHSDASQINRIYVKLHSWKCPEWKEYWYIYHKIPISLAYMAVLDKFMIFEIFTFGFEL